MSIIEFERPASWSIDTSETGESSKCPWVEVVEGTAGGDQDGGRRTHRSIATISRKNRGL